MLLQFVPLPVDTLLSGYALCALALYFLRWVSAIAIQAIQDWCTQLYSSLAACRQVHVSSHMLIVNLYQLIKRHAFVCLHPVPEALSCVHNRFVYMPYAPTPSACSLKYVCVPAVKHCVRLRTSGAYREACGSVLVVGEVPLSELGGGSAPIRQHSTAVRVCFLSEGAEVPAGLRPERVLHASPEVMAKLAGLESAAGARRCAFA